MQERTISAAKRRDYLARVKTTRGCVDCGYSANPVALDFDHVDPATKRFTIAMSGNRQWTQVLDELAKCVVRCANCHRIRSAEQNRARWAEGHRKGSLSLSV